MLFNLLNLFVGIVGSIGIVQVLLSNDITARIKCRTLCCDLKQLLEDFAGHLFCPSRNAQNDLPKLKEIKKVIERLDVEKISLFFPCQLLNKLIEESYPLFDRVRIKDGNSAHKPSFVGCELLELWGLGESQPSKFAKPLEIQKLLQKSFRKRFMHMSFWNKFKTWPRRLPLLARMTPGLTLALVGYGSLLLITVLSGKMQSMIAWIAVLPLAMVTGESIYKRWCSWADKVAN